MESTLTAAVAGIAALYVFLNALLYLSQDKREPKAVENSIPFLSPVLSMLKRKSAFWNYARDKYGLPIYTVRMPNGSRMYVINSLPLITAAQRQGQSISLRPIVIEAVERMLGASKESSAMLAHDLDHKGDYLLKFQKVTWMNLAPGAALDAMTRTALKTTARVFDELQEKTVNAPLKTGLFDWIGHTMVQVSTDSAFGTSRNPLHRPEIEDAWNAYHPDMSSLLLLPSFLSRRALKAREVVISAFEEYFSAGGSRDPDAAEMTRARYEYSISSGTPKQDVSRFEAANVFALLGNTIPTSFWLLYHLYSDPEVLADCRKEAEALVSVQRQADGTQIHTIDVSRVKSSCPILASTLQEVLRCHNVALSARYVREDHMLDGKYLLKKDSAVIMPSSVQHMDASIWGPDVREFKHRRFVQVESVTDERGEKKQKLVPKPPPNQSAFRGFGGGSMMCPGRFFVTAEVLAFMALMVMRFDMKPARTRNGKWPEPKMGGGCFMPNAVAEPAGDLPVEISLRGPSTQKWVVEFSGADSAEKKLDLYA